VIVKQVIKDEVRASGGKIGKLYEGMSLKIFQVLTDRGEVRKYVDYLFKVKYERIDFAYLEIKDLHTLFNK
jgi:hypothetical protein